MKKNKLSIYIVLSIIVHILLLLLLQMDKSVFFNPQQPDALPKEDRLTFKLVETPDVEDQLPDAESDLVSDKNTKASDLNESDLPDNELPFQTGDITQKSFQENETNQTQETQLQSQNEEKISDILAELHEKKPTFMEDYQSRQKLRSFKENTPEYNQEVSTTRDKGGMKFNTYAWDFAPYLLHLKRKVQSHINPPYAFTRLGAIDGNTLIRFKIMQDGSLRDLEVVGSDAHYALDDTSTRAIKYSAPFIPLPANFPEPYLEVTALFSYLIGNKKK